MNFRFKETNRIKREAEKKKKKKKKEKKRKKKNEEEIIKHEKKKKEKIYQSFLFFCEQKNTIFSPPEQGYTICYFCSIFYFLESGRVRSVKLGIGIYF